MWQMHLCKQAKSKEQSSMLKAGPPDHLPLHHLILCSVRGGNRTHNPFREQSHGCQMKSVARRYSPKIMSSLGKIVAIRQGEAFLLRLGKQLPAIGRMGTVMANAKQFGAE